MGRVKSHRANRTSYLGRLGAAGRRPWRGPGTGTGRWSMTGSAAYGGVLGRTRVLWRVSGSAERRWRRCQKFEGPDGGFSERSSASASTPPQGPLGPQTVSACHASARKGLNQVQSAVRARPEASHWLSGSSERRETRARKRKGAYACVVARRKLRSGPFLCSPFFVHSTLGAVRVQLVWIRVGRMKLSIDRSEFRDCGELESIEPGSV